jgi:anti-sigma B factor antagonist
MSTIAPEFTLVVTDDLGWANVSVIGELDLATADDLQDTLRDELQGGRSVVLDLSRVQFVDSSGITAILRAMAIARELDRGFAMRSTLPKPVERVARICGVLGEIPVV